MSEIRGTDATPHGESSAAPVPRDLSPETERIFVRMTIWQTVIGLAGVFIGLVALYAALQESEAVRRQTAAAVWPIVQFTTVDAQNEERASFAVRLTNAGVGPARMRGLRMVLAGEVVHDWEEAAAVAGGELDATAQRWSVVNLVLRPGEQLDIFSTGDPALVRGLVAAVAHADSALEYCYCSIFDECWLADASGAGPEPVERCPDFGADAFRH